MTLHAPTSIKRSSPPIVNLLAVTASLGLLLWSCDGRTATTTPPAPTTSKTVPAGWIGRAPKPEVINGITVPPEPAPSVNNATLAGVDSNNNGIRDDVERVIATIFGNTDQYKVVSFAVQSAQSGIVSSLNDSRFYMTRYKCNIGLGSIDPLNYEALHRIIFNTKIRRDVFLRTLPESGTAYTITITESGTLSNLDDPCAGVTSPTVPYPSND